ncbi:hypothetical protein FOXYSP1_12835 [Fusarium oxysporum f. sp. phaseoli]
MDVRQSSSTLALNSMHSKQCCPAVSSTPDHQSHPLPTTSLFCLSILPVPPTRNKRLHRPAAENASIIHAA